MKAKLLVLDTHPIQYHAPVYRAVREYGIEVQCVYGSDFSVAGYFDKEFRSAFCWDVNLSIGNGSEIFLSRADSGGVRRFEDVRATGLAKVLRETQPDAVLVTGYGSRFHFRSLCEVWRSRRPILFRAETTDHAGRRSRTMQLVRDGALRYLYSRCRWLLPIGVRSRQHYLRLGVPTGKLLLSPYCVDTAPFRCGESDRDAMRTASRRQFGIPDKSVVLLFSGKLSPRKAPGLLVEAAKRLPGELRERTTLMFLGDGEQRADLSAMAAGQPHIRAHFTGFQNQTALSPLYHAADLLVLPSLWGETWGLVVNEALHHGVPCVVSDAVGCGPDLVSPGVTGDVAETGSANSLSEAIQRCMQLVGSASVREDCRRRVSSYSVENAAAGIAQAFWSAVRSSNCSIPCLESVQER